MNESTRQEIVDAGASRAAFYRFLASLFLYELTEEQIETLAHTEFPQDGSTTARGYATIHEYLRHRDTGTRQELAVDYARVFLGAGNYDTITAPPYESVYTSPERLLMQDSRDDVLLHYHREGLSLPEDNTTPEDHAGFELQFMAELVDRCSAAVKEGDVDRFAVLVREQDEFFRQHMDNWMHRFADDIDEYCKTDFYHGAADLLRGLLEVEGPLIRELCAIAEVEQAASAQAAPEAAGDGETEAR